jgi:hypothetical protein
MKAVKNAQIIIRSAVNVKKITFYTMDNALKFSTKTV